MPQQLNKLYYRYTNEGYNSEGEDFISQDWDNLLILDACRFDSFKELNSIEGDLQAKKSRASSTVGFLDSNISNRELHDTVYVSANPQLEWKSELFSPDFHDVIHVWKEDGWDSSKRTVLPSTVNEFAVKANEKYPNKRLIIHYLQPHCPFIGKKGDSYTDGGGIDFWPKVRAGKIDTPVDVLFDAYHENLEVVLESVEKLTDMIGGKTVVTSDHGQLIGERSFPIPFRDFGHPQETFVSELVNVPWLEIDGDRRAIKSESPQGYDKNIEDDVIKERLENLGYRA
ncbi:hypothetical protein [Halogranum gelatinilyticum]|uniref:hypothetical protein n=1 Tax=Halogranum gelatinilyticum TaxID=660521 RepID=UPI001113ED99|nr:hypothetical protein [Halogranum gelatinilyticum]